MTDAKWFGERLKKARADHVGLTQQELSALSGINQQQISKFESHERMPSLENFKKLCITLDVNADYMLCLLYTSPSPRDRQKSRMPSSA